MEEIGDKLLWNKEEGMLRIVFQNVESLPKGRHRDKNWWLFNFCTEWKVDILGMVEINWRWHRIDPPDHLPERFRGWWEMLHTSIAYNRSDNGASQFQWGGMALLLVDSAAH